VITCRFTVSRRRRRLQGHLGLQDSVNGLGRKEDPRPQGSPPTGSGTPPSSRRRREPKKTTKKVSSSPFFLYSYNGDYFAVCFSFQGRRTSGFQDENGRKRPKNHVRKNGRDKW